MANGNKLEDSIHLRAVRYGYKRPNGFLYKDIAEHYRRRKEEWEVVRKFLMDAWRNHTEGVNLNTPYSLLEKKANIDDCPFILSYEAYFNYLDYLELVEARKNARQAFWMSLVAILIALYGIFFK